MDTADTQVCLVQLQSMFASTRMMSGTGRKEGVHHSFFLFPFFYLLYLYILVYNICGGTLHFMMNRFQTFGEVTDLVWSYATVLRTLKNF